MAFEQITCSLNQPLDVGVLRDDVSLQRLHQVFVVTRPIKLLNLLLLVVSFDLGGGRGVGGGGERVLKPIIRLSSSIKVKQFGPRWRNRTDQPTGKYT